MPLHFPSTHKKSNLSVSPNGNGVPAVNKSTTFGLGPGQWKVTDEKHPSSLSSNLRKMREKGSLTDISFAYDNECVKANRVILAAVSPVMRNVFTKREGLMNAEVIPLEELSQLVRFVYNANTEVNVKAIQQIAKAAKALEATAIKTVCEKILQILPPCPATQVKRRPKLKRMLGFDEATTLGEDVADGNELNIEGKGNLVVAGSANRSGSICSIGSDASGLVMETPTKRDNRASIRLTFHSRPSTPLNQSLEEDQDGCTCTETGCKDIPFSCKSVSGCAATDGTLSSSFGQSITENDGKNVTEPSLAHASPTKPRSSSHGPIPLSAVLKANTDLSSSDSPQPKRSFTQTAIAGKSSKKGPNGTWPRRLKDAGSRTAIPVQWRTTPRDILISTSDAQRVANHQVEQVKAAKTRRTRDTYSVGFKSEAIPGLLKGLSQLRDQGLFCDLTLIVGNARINCHRVVLAASSPIFYAIVQKIASKEIALTKVDEAAVQEIVRFIYSGQCTIDKDNVMGVLRASYSFQFDFVAQQCASYLERNGSSVANILSSENVLLAYRISEIYSCPRLREESRKIAASKFWELTDTQSFKDLSSLDLNRLISSESLRTARLKDSELELQFFLALYKWLTHKTGRLPRMTSRVMKFVQFDNIKAPVLRRIILKEAVVMDDPETTRRVQMALRNQTARFSPPVTVAVQTSPALSRDSKETLKAIVLHNNNNDTLSNVLYSVKWIDSNWEQVSSCPVALSGYAVATKGNAVYVAGGRDVKTNKHIRSDVFKYENNRWIQLTGMLVDRAHFAIVPVGGALYALGGMTERMEKGRQGYQITSSVERMEIGTSSENFGWKMASTHLPCPSYFHGAVVCEMVVRCCPPKSPLNGRKDEKSSIRKWQSPNLSRLGQRFNLLSGKGTGTTENDSSSSRNALSQNAIKAIKPPGQNDEKNRTMRRPVIMICGGKSQPTQNVLFDPVENKTVDKRPLPSPMTSPTMASTSSRLFIASSGADCIQQGSVLMYQYSLTDDLWTEIKLPGQPGQSSVAAGKLSRLRSSFRGREDRHHVPSKLLLSCSVYQSRVVCAVVNGCDVTLHTYDASSENWTSLKSRKCFELPTRAFSLLSLQE